MECLRAVQPSSPLSCRIQRGFKTTSTEKKKWGNALLDHKSRKCPGSVSSLLGNGCCPVVEGILLQKPAGYLSSEQAMPDSSHEGGIISRCCCECHCAWLSVRMGLRVAVSQTQRKRCRHQSLQSRGVYSDHRQISWSCLIRDLAQPNISLHSTYESCHLCWFPRENTCTECSMRSITQGETLKPQDHRKWKRRRRRNRIPKMKECPIHTFFYKLKICKINSLLRQAGLFSACTALVMYSVRRRAQGPHTLCSAEAEFPHFKP